MIKNIRAATKINTRMGTTWKMPTLKIRRSSLLFSRKYGTVNSRIGEIHARAMAILITLEVINERYLSG